MADLKFSYELLEELTNKFKEIKQDFEKYGQKVVDLIDSDDPVAEHHVYCVQERESELMVATVGALQNAQDGSQSVYDDFKAADEAGEG